MKQRLKHYRLIAMVEPSRDDVNLFTNLTNLSPAEAIKWLKVALRTSHPLISAADTVWICRHIITM